jgi:hypothetical protein
MLNDISMYSAFLLQHGSVLMRWLCIVIFSYTAYKGMIICSFHSELRAAITDSWVTFCYQLVSRLGLA